MQHDDETALLAAVLAGYSDLPALARIVAGSDFYRPAHEQIWLACVAIHSEGHQPDPNLVRERLTETGAKVDPAYLIDLLSAPSVGVNAPRYAEAVREESVRRQLKASAQRLDQLADNRELDTGDVLAKFRSELDGLDQHRPAARASSWDAFEAAMTEQAPGIPTPWPDLTDMIGGWFPGQLITIGARPSVGKSLMLENACTVAARSQGCRCLFVSLEMTKRDLMQRTIAWTSMVPMNRLRFPNQLTDEELGKVASVQDLITSTPVEIDEDPHRTLADIRAAAWEVHQTAVRNGEQPGPVFVDYIQLITPAKGTHQQTRQQQVGEFSRGLKRLAKELEVPVMVGAQLNRTSVGRGNGEPILSDLREAGDIEQDSDVVILLHEETVDYGGKQTPTGFVSAIVAKNRQGARGVVTLQRHGHLGRFSPPQPGALRAA